VIYEKIRAAARAVLLSSSASIVTARALLASVFVPGLEEKRERKKGADLAALANHWWRRSSS